MYTGRSYPLKLTLGWTLKFVAIFAVVSAIPVIMHKFFLEDVIIIPWLPVALIGTALAFYLGFKTNASYDRLWEARKIWGGIVNSSRAWAFMCSTYITESAENKNIREAKLRLVNRHIAWMNALRYQLRDRRKWEHNNLRDNEEYRKATQIEEFEVPMEDALKPYISEAEFNHISKKQNKAAQLLHLQMQDLAALHETGNLDNFRHVEMGNVIKSLVDEQGKSERIKNFPFPRQYASLNFYYVWMFIILLPFGMFKEFGQLGEHYMWLNIPFCCIVSWVFYTMEMIGDYSENPFEGSFNDVPVTSISRGIEIDILEMVEADNIPAPKGPHNEVLF